METSADSMQFENIPLWEIFVMKLSASWIQSLRVNLSFEAELINSRTLQSFFAQSLKILLKEFARATVEKLSFAQTLSRYEFQKEKKITRRNFSVIVI